MEFVLVLVCLTSRDFLFFSIVLFLIVMAVLFITFTSLSIATFWLHICKMLAVIVDLIYSFKFRMERQRREEEQKSRTSRKGNEAEQSILNRVSGLYYSLLSLSKGVGSVPLEFRCK